MNVIRGDEYKLSQPSMNFLVETPGFKVYSIMDARQLNQMVGEIKPGKKNKRMISDKWIKLRLFRMKRLVASLLMDSN